MATRVRKPATERREQIARAVLRIIGDRGISALTTSTLAAEVGVTSGALFRHFPTRDAMLEEATAHALAHVDRTFPDPQLPPLDRLLELARNRVRLLGSDAGIAWVLRSDQAHLALPARAVAKLRRRVERSRRVLLTAIREGAAEGTIRTDIAPAVLLVIVMGAIHAVVGMPGAHRLAEDDALTAESERVLNALELLLAPPR